MNKEHNWQWVSADKYHITYRSEYCGEVQVYNDLKKHLEKEVLDKVADYVKKELPSDFNAVMLINHIATLQNEN